MNLFVNYWWNDAPVGIGRPYDALMFGLFALRALPPEQRDVWRMVFDHYVFHANGDPAEHLPADARGVLGTTDAGAARANAGHPAPVSGRGLLTCAS